MALQRPVPSAPVSPAQPLFGFHNPWLVAGVVLYPLNYATDRMFNLPMADLLLPFLLFFMAIQQGALGKIGRMPGFVLFLVYMAWVTMANTLHGVALMPMARMTFVLATLWLPVFCYMLLGKRENVMALIVGSIIGFGLVFGGFAAFEYVNGGISRDLRWIQPTPVVALVLYLLLGKEMSTPVKWLLSLTVVLSMVVGLEIESRGPILSLLMVIPFLLVARFVKGANIIMPLMVAAGLMMHWFTGLTSAMPLYDQIVDSAQDTVSNRERAFLIDYCLSILRDHPFIGIPFPSFAIEFGEYFAYVDKVREASTAVQTPHNTFLEQGTFYGYPAAFAFVLALVRVLYKGLQSSRMSLLGMAAVMAGITRLGAFYGYSGTLRIEWFALLFALYYAYVSVPPKPLVAPPVVAPARRPRSRTRPAS